MTRKLCPESINLVGEIKHTPVEALKLWDNNPRHNDHVVEPLSRSIEAYGMNAPILVNAKMQVIAGNTRLKACRLLGMTHVPTMDGSHLSVEQQQAYNIADNKFSEMAQWDHSLLDAAMAQQQSALQEQFDASLLGFIDAPPVVDLPDWADPADSSADEAGKTDAATVKITITCPVAIVEDVRRGIRAHLQREGHDTLRVS